MLSKLRTLAGCFNLSREEISGEPFPSIDPHCGYVLKTPRTVKVGGEDGLDYESIPSIQPISGEEAYRFLMQRVFKPKGQPVLARS